MQKKKMGRPTESRKATQIAVRFDDETLQVLDRFCDKEKVSRAEGIRKAVRKLEKKIRETPFPGKVERISYCTR